MSKDFVPWPKIPRLDKNNILITEKIDGTNAQVSIEQVCREGEPDIGLDEWQQYDPSVIAVQVGECNDMVMRAGSRTRWLRPNGSALNEHTGKPDNTLDNFGFAQWVVANAAELFKLGPGSHYGEWYGRGIQRGYGLEDRRFALFNVDRWLGGPDSPDNRPNVSQFYAPSCCEMVPVLYRGPWLDEKIKLAAHNLQVHGSNCVPVNTEWSGGAEGMVIYQYASHASFKVIFDSDGPKGPKDADGNVL